MQEQLAIQNLLRNSFGEIQSKNPRYSLRAYSDRIGLNPGTVSSIMNGKRNVSKKLAEKITRKLLIDPQKRSEILEHFPKKIRSPSEKSHSPRYFELEASKFKMMAEWEHYAVLSLMNCSEFQSDFPWIAQRLGITEVRAKDVIDRLISVGIIRQGQNGAFERDKNPYRSSDEVINLSLRKSHDVTMDLAKESLHREDLYLRDFTHLTMAIDIKKIPEAKEMIREFQDRLSEVMESGDRTEVYRFSTQLFPLTKLAKNKEV